MTRGSRCVPRVGPPLRCREEARNGLDFGSRYILKLVTGLALGRVS